MLLRRTALLVALSVIPFFTIAKESKDIFLCSSRGDFHFSFSAPDMAVGKVIILTMWQKNGESRGALGIVRELSQTGDLVADFPGGSDLKIDQKKITTTLKYIAGLKEGILIVAPNNIAVGDVVSGKCKITKTSKK